MSNVAEDIVQEIGRLIVKDDNELTPERIRQITIEACLRRGATPDQAALMGQVAVEVRQSFLEAFEPLPAPKLGVFDEIDWTRDEHHGAIVMLDEETPALQGA